MCNESPIIYRYLIYLDFPTIGTENMTSAGKADLDHYVIASQRFARNIFEVGLLPSFPSSYHAYKATLRLQDDHSCCWDDRIRAS